MPLDSGEGLGPITWPTKPTVSLTKSVVTPSSFCMRYRATPTPRLSLLQKPKTGLVGYLYWAGQSVDTNKFFVICSNVIGGCQGSTGPSSMNPLTGKPYGLSFPVITIGDMVRAQQHLIDYLGIDKLLAVAGGVWWDAGPANGLPATRIACGRLCLWPRPPATHPC